MKKFLISILSLICIVFGAAGLSACSAEGGGSGSNSGSGGVGGSGNNNVAIEKQYNENIKYKLSYTSDEECPSGNIDDNHLYASIDFEIDKVYYMIVDFTISNFELDGWDSSFSSSIKISPSIAMQATLEEAATGNFTEKEEEGSKNITTTYSIPEDITEERSYRFIVQLKPLKDYGWASAELAFYGDGENVETASYSEEFIIFNATQSLTYELNSGKKSYTVTGCSDKNLTCLVIPATYETLPITDISANAFNDFDKLDSAYILDSVTSIGSSAFSGCTSLESITVQKSNAVYHSNGNCIIETEGKTLMAGCKNSIIPSDGSVISIGEYAFYGCTGLTSIKIPYGVTSIGSSAFYNCENLKSIDIPDSVTSIGSSAFQNCSSFTSIRIIPDRVISIGDSAFSGCSKLESVDIPDSVTSIGTWAFENCTSLTAVYITDIVSWCNIEFVSSSSNPLYYAHNLYLDKKLVTTLEIPYDVTSIGENAFYNCTSLESITIPDSVTSIGSDAFSGCFNLERITVSEGNSEYSSQDGILYNKTKTTFIHIPQAIKGSIIIPSGITSIGGSAFSGCSNIKSIDIPDGVTSIGSYAFSGCSSLTSIIIPDSVISIGGSAFENCTRLESITIPFVGATKDGTANTHFGYIFGASSYSYNSSYVPSSLKTVVITEGNSIGNYAFYNCANLTCIEIPDSVASIGNSAFSGCTSLETVYWDATNCTSAGSYLYPIFNGCTALTEVIIGDEVQTIPDSAFRNCISLANVTLGENSKLQSIGNYAFSSCTSLESIEIPDSVTSIGNWAFENCTSLTSIKIPDRVKSIGSSAFKDCFNLETITVSERNSEYSSQDGILYNKSKTIIVHVPQAIKGSIIIPSGITSIGNYVFEDCTSLISVTIGNSVKSIGIYAFSSCINLTSIIIPDSVTSIGGSAFENCTRLESITIPFVGATKDGTANTHFGYIFGAYSNSYNSSYVPASLKTVVITGGNSIGNYAFYNCANLESIEIPDSVTTIGSSAFSSCANLESIEIPYSVKSIGDYAFSKCTSLKNITIPDGVPSIGSYAFRYCESLKSIIIPDSVTSIGSYAFEDCTSLISVTIGNSVKSIGGSAFSGCTSLETVYWNAINCTSVGSNVAYQIFKGCTALTEVIIGNEVQKIPESAFYNCTSLISVTVGNSVTSIGDSAFRNCTSLISVTVGNSVTSISKYAFSGCTSLESIEIPASVTSIGDMAFYNCTSLKSVVFKNTVGWQVYLSSSMPNINISDLSDPATAAKLLTDTYLLYHWQRS